MIDFNGDQHFSPETEVLHQAANKTEVGTMIIIKMDDYEEEGEV